MKPYLFLFFALASFAVVSCSKHTPPDIVGTWMGVEMETYNYTEDGIRYNESYYTFWEGERILIFNDDGTWEEQRDAVTYSGTWELREYGYDEWLLTMKQSSVTKTFWIGTNGSTLVLTEKINSWHSITRYRRIE